LFANQIAAINDRCLSERPSWAEKRRIYEEDVDLLRLATQLVIDAVGVAAEDLRRRTSIRAGRAAEGKDRCRPTGCHVSRPDAAGPSLSAARLPLLPITIRDVGPRDRPAAEATRWVGSSLG